MLEAKLPPLNPAVAAISRNTQYGVPGSLTANPSSTAGISSRALATVKSRPPKRAGPKV